MKAEVAGSSLVYHPMLRLVTPSVHYKNDFIDAVKEYQETDSSERRDIFDLRVEDLKKDFPGYVSRLRQESLGNNLPKGYVPQTTYWLFDEDKFIGRVSIRHRLNDFLFNEGGHIGYDIRPSKRNKGYGTKILSLAIPLARDLGIAKILVTCSENNIASKKIIEHNGGVFENMIEANNAGPKKMRYWIS